MNKVSNLIEIDHDAERLAHDPALMDHVAHVLCLQGEMNILFNSHHFVLHKDDIMAVPIQALLEEKKPSEDFRCICIYVGPELMRVPDTPPLVSAWHDDCLQKPHHACRSREDEAAHH